MQLKDVFMNRYMALDVGDRTIGVAVSDPLFIMAEGYSTIFRESIEKDLESLKNIIVKENIIKVVVGLPKNMNNTIGLKAELSEKFKKMIIFKTGLSEEKIFLYDYKQKFIFDKNGLRKTILLSDFDEITKETKEKRGKCETHRRVLHRRK